MDNETFLALLKPCEKSLRLCASKLTNHKNADAEDLYQDTILKALNKKNNFEEGTNFGAWIFRIMRNTFIDSTRKKWNPKNVQLTEHFHDGMFPHLAGNLDNDIQLDLAKIENLCESLPGNQILAFMLTYDHSYSTEEAAEFIGVTPSTVRSDKSKAIQKLRPLAKNLLSLPAPDP